MMQAARMHTPQKIDAHSGRLPPTRLLTGNADVTLAKLDTKTPQQRQKAKVSAPLFIHACVA